MGTDIQAIFAEHEADRFALHSQYLNEQIVRVIKALGYDTRFVRAKGQYLWDGDGTRYLDLLCGFGVFAVGRNHPNVQQALQQALACELPNLVQLDVSPLAGVLAKRLLERVPYLDKVFFANSGSESVEAAIKFARAATGRRGIAYCSNSFHGLTYGALSLNSQASYRDGLDGFLADCAEVPFNDLDALEDMLRSEKIAAVFVEPIQGRGVYIADPDYLPGVQGLCRRYGTLFVADEVQTGLGRTGRFLGVEHWGVEPDIVLLAKGLSGGQVPVGALLTRKWIFEKLFGKMSRVAVHGSTFAKNNMAMAAGLATLDTLEEEKLIENAADKGSRLLDAFRAMQGRHELIKEVRGKGLVIGIELGAPRSMGLRMRWNALEAIKTGLFCQTVVMPLFKEHKILVQVSGDTPTIKLQPPLLITDEDCTWIIDAFESAIAAAHKAGTVWTLGKTLARRALRARAE